MILRLRPHHFLCVLGFQGKGYDDGFAANMARIVAILRAPQGGSTMIEVVSRIDDICAPCPHRAGASCEAQEKISRLDRVHGAALGLSPGDRLSWGTARDRIRATIRPEDLGHLCPDCQWRPLGLCEAALGALHRS
ncbi:hypothetical protein C8N32_10559 [Rhodovulum imhoffii]|uniref:DUF1284 domain-containing protein n=1 Tax=Rhodovulum imhoffii TaxID=365340 RepID=A0A2T5BTK0_9RHOB|nr:DUF1284 domain-containing protein [Rhodovulum imhoffii]MBK5934360.1 hypothetical protein [Rhodovulum imhoffii]PTN02689.1 hypothetical protein C8N32_10559 [Rhodovulum imhoffii]